MWLHWERTPGSVYLISSRLCLICLLLVHFSLSLYIVINHSSECNYMDESCESFQWISKPWGNLRDLWHIFSFSPRYLISCKIFLIQHPLSLTSHSVFLLHFHCYYLGLDYCTGLLVTGPPISPLSFLRHNSHHFTS